MKDRFGTVIYIGKATSLRKRVSQYFHPSRRQRWDMKFNALVDAIEDFDVHQVRSEPDALLLEGKLIKEFKPRYNISFKDDKRFLLLKVNLKDPIPRFTLTRLRQDDGALYYGPFASSGAIRRTMTMVRQKFSLRGCRPRTRGRLITSIAFTVTLSTAPHPALRTSREKHIFSKSRLPVTFWRDNPRKSNKTSVP